MPTTIGSGQNAPQTSETELAVVGKPSIGSGQTPNQAARVVGNVRRLANGWIEYRNPHPESGKTRWRIDRKWHFSCGRADCAKNGIEHHKHGTHRSDVPGMSEENYVNWKQARIVARRKRRERAAIA